jgi:hypothetical protein
MSNLWIYCYFNSDTLFISQDESSLAYLKTGLFMCYRDPVAPNTVVKFHNLCNGSFLPVFSEAPRHNGT